MGLEVVVPCAACYNRLRTAVHKVRENPELRKKVNQILQADFAGSAKVRHISDAVINEYGLEAIGKLLAKNLKGMKVVCYYGCLSARPQKIVAFDDPVYPSYLDRLIRALGGEPIEWPFKTECCGGSFSVSKKEIVLKLTGDLLDMAKRSGRRSRRGGLPVMPVQLGFPAGRGGEKIRRAFRPSRLLLHPAPGNLPGPPGGRPGPEKTERGPFCLVGKQEFTAMISPRRTQRTQKCKIPNSNSPTGTEVIGTGDLHRAS